MVDFAILMENIVKLFEDVVAVDGVSLKVSRGELYGLLGPNGAGKTQAGFSLRVHGARHVYLLPPYSSQ